MSRKTLKRVAFALGLYVLLAPIVHFIRIESWDPEPVQPAITNDTIIAILKNKMIVRGWQAIEDFDRTFWLRGAGTFYGSTGGSGTTCSSGSPGSLATVLTQGGCSGQVAGDTILLKEGNYTSGSGTTSTLTGTSGARITVMADPANAHGCPDTGGCGVQLIGTSKLTTRLTIAGAYTTYQGFDVHSTFGVRQTNQNISFPDNILGGAIGSATPITDGQFPGVKLVGLVVHNSRNGVQPYVGFTDFEMEGCIIFENGWNDPNDGSGLSVYTQNTVGTKTFNNNVFWGNTGENVQAYASGAGGVINMHFVKNTFFADGALDFRNECGAQRNFTFGGTNPLSNAIADNNWFWGCGPTGGSSGSSHYMGYNSDCPNLTLTNNYYGSVHLQFGNGVGCTQPSTMTGNTITFDPTTTSGSAHPFVMSEYPSNTYLHGTLPTSNRIFVDADLYIANRGLAKVYNWTSASSVSIDISSIIPIGANWEIRNVADLSQTPQASGTNYAGGSVSVAMNNLTVATPIQVTLTPSPTVGPTTPTPTPSQYSLTPLPPTMRNPSTTGPRFATFMINVVPGGASTPTPSPSFTSTSTATLTPTPTFTQTFTPSRTPTGGATLTPTKTNTPAATFTPTRTPTVTPTPSGSQQAWGMDSCTVVAPAVKTTSAGVFPGGSYSSSPTSNSGHISCVVNVTSAPPQRLWVYLRALASNADSVFIDIDGDGSAQNCLVDGDSTCPFIFDMGESQQPCTGGPPTCVYGLTLSPTLQWNMLNDRTVTCGFCSFPPGGDPGPERVLNLSPGLHTISFRFREVSAGESGRLAYFVLTNDMNYNPANSFLPTPTPGPSNCKTAFLCKNRIVYSNQPCNQPPRRPCPNN